MACQIKPLIPLAPSLLAQVWSGSALPEPKDFGLRKGCGLLEMLRHVAGDVLVVEMQARGQDPVLHVPRAS